MEWFGAHGPYLIQKDPIAPHITGRLVLVIADSLRSSPLHRDLSTMRNIVAIILESS